MVGPSLACARASARCCWCDVCGGPVQLASTIASTDLHRTRGSAALGTHLTQAWAWKQTHPVGCCVFTRPEKLVSLFFFRETANLSTPARGRWRRMVDGEWSRVHSSLADKWKIKFK